MPSQHIVKKYQISVTGNDARKVAKLYLGENHGINGHNHKTWFDVPFDFIEYAFKNYKSVTTLSYYLQKETRLEVSGGSSIYIKMIE